MFIWTFFLFQQKIPVLEFPKTDKTCMISLEPKNSRIQNSRILEFRNSEFQVFQISFFNFYLQLIILDSMFLFSCVPGYLLLTSDF
jgi:hypothetical protein